MREIGVETGGSNVQFAMNPNGRMVVIEMNPRVSRSSALASKATGFPIAKIAAKLAVGYTLDEIPNDITRETPACFEPTLDYCVVKIPALRLREVQGRRARLGVSMKSVGETMAIGATSRRPTRRPCAAWSGVDGYDLKLRGQGRRDGTTSRPRLAKHRARPPLSDQARAQDGHPARPSSPRLTKIDPWFLDNFMQIVEMEARAARRSEGPTHSTDLLKEAKRIGFSDARSPHCAAKPARRTDRSAASARRPASSRCTAWSTPARASSRPTRRTSIRVTRPSWISRA
jgi:carbamoyl-phosphate synthase large subunit